MTNFNEMGLPAPLMQCLTQNGFINPTPIQAETIPLALKGNDVLGSAQTGTGKTLAFTIPVVAKLLEDKNGIALFLTPTRELAQQVMTSVTQLVGRNSSLNVALLIGGEPYPKQLTQLRRGPRIIVGTPGRVIDHIGRGTIKNQHINMLVLDETDRMLDMGFGIQLEEIISQIPRERQTLMFSATFLPRIEKLAANYLTNPQRVFMAPTIQPIEKIHQETINVKESEKFDNLMTQLSQRDGSIIIFVKTKINAEKLTTSLLRENHDVSAIHGDLRQKKRDQVMRDFRKGQFRIMVATDVAARGLDVPEIRHVINYNLPQCPEDYVHRIGRTARNGAEGSALNLVSPSENKLWSAIEHFLDPTKKQKSFESRPFTKSRSPSSGGNRSFGNRKPFGRDQSQGFGRDSDRPNRWSEKRTDSSSQDRDGRFGQSRPNPFKSDRPDSRDSFGPRRPQRDGGDNDRFPRERSFGAKPAFNRGSDRFGNRDQAPGGRDSTRSFSRDDVPTRSFRPQEDRFDKPSFNSRPRSGDRDSQFNSFRSGKPQHARPERDGNRASKGDTPFFRDFGDQKHFSDQARFNQANKKSFGAKKFESDDKKQS